MILADWTTFRYAFAERAEASATVTFINSNPDTITRGAGSFVDEGVEVGMTIDWSGTANNNNRYTITAVSALGIDLDSSDAVTAEGPVAASYVAVHRDLDGIETWPTALVRAAGFDDGITGIDRPLTFPLITATVNSGNDDAVSGVDEYDWYVSMRTDTPANQMLKVWDYHHFLGSGNTKSGSIVIALSDLGMRRLGVSDSVSPTSLATLNDLYRNVHIYCRRRSDGAIQWIDVLRYANGLG